MCLQPFNFYSTCGHALPAGPLEKCYDDNTDPHLSPMTCPYYEAGIRHPAQGVCPDCEDKATEAGAGMETTTAKGAQEGQVPNFASAKETGQEQQDMKGVNEEDEEWEWMERWWNGHL